MFLQLKKPTLLKWQDETYRDCFFTTVGDVLPTEITWKNHIKMLLFTQIFIFMPIFFLATNI